MALVCESFLPLEYDRLPFGAHLNKRPNPQSCLKVNLMHSWASESARNSKSELRYDYSIGRRSASEEARTKYTQRTLEDLNQETKCNVTLTDCIDVTLSLGDLLTQCSPARSALGIEIWALAQSHSPVPEPLAIALVVVRGGVEDAAVIPDGWTES